MLNPKQLLLISLAFTSLLIFGSPEDKWAPPKNRASFYRPPKMVIREAIYLKSDPKAHTLGLPSNFKNRLQEWTKLHVYGPEWVKIDGHRVPYYSLKAPQGIQYYFLAKLPTKCQSSVWIQIDGDDLWVENVRNYQSRCAVPWPFNDDQYLDNYQYKTLLKNSRLNRMVPIPKSQKRLSRKLTQYVKLALKATKAIRKEKRLSFKSQ